MIWNGREFFCLFLLIPRPGDSSCLYKLLPTVFCNEKVKAMNGLIKISTINNRISFVGCGDCLNKWTDQSCLSLCWNLLQRFIWCPDWEDSRWDYLSTILCGIALWCLQNTCRCCEELVLLWRLKYWMAGTGDQHIGDQIFALTAVKLSCVLCTQETDYLCQVFVARRFLAIC